MAALWYPYWHHGNRLIQLCGKLRGLTFYVFNMSKRHYARMAIKAMGKKQDYQEACADIEGYDRENNR